MRPGAFVLVIGLCAGCSGGAVPPGRGGSSPGAARDSTSGKGPRAGPGAPSEVLQVRHRLIPEGAFLEGEIATLEITLSNLSADRFVLLKRIEEARTRGVRLNWERARRGELRHDREADVYILDTSKVRETTGRVFQTGLLLPRTEIDGTVHTDRTTLKVRLRLLHLPWSLWLRYRVLDRDQVLQRVYFPVNAPPRKGAGHLKLFQRASPLYLKRYVEERYAGPYSTALRKDMYLFDPARAGAVPERVVLLRVKDVVPQRKFSLRDAARIAGWSVLSDYTWCGRLNGWILMRKDGTTALVRPEGAVRIPPCDAALFFALDTEAGGSLGGRGTVQIEFMDETQFLFEKFYPFARAGELRRNPGALPRGKIFSTRGAGETYSHFLILPEIRLVEFFARAGLEPRIRLGPGPDGSVRVHLR